jgi:hypothetical protein
MERYVAVVLTMVLGTCKLTVFFKLLVGNIEYFVAEFVDFSGYL